MLGLVAAAAGSSCGDDGDRAAPRGVKRGGGGGIAGPAGAKGEQAHRRQTAERDRPRKVAGGAGKRAGDGDERKQPPVGDTSDAATPGREEERRDLGHELGRALRDSVACVPDPFVEDLPERLEVDVTVHVTAEGRVTRAYVSAKALPTAARRCIRKRAEAVHFDPPIPAAPRQVHTTVGLQRRSGESR